MASELLRQALGARVRAARHERAMSLRDLAARSGVSKALLSTIERGDGNPSIDTLFRLGTALGLPISALVTDEGDGGPEIVRAGEGQLVSWLDRPLEVRLIFASAGHRRIELYECDLPAGSRSQWDSHHGDGVSEFITIREGHALVGPVGSEQPLAPGDAIVLRPGSAHAVEALDEDVRFTSVLAYPF
jgi:transcriptional regulator with XRE-family HTH domain